jgi:opacity protein-like surface antigen
MKRKVMMTLLPVLISVSINAQWEVGLGAGVALPITGYKEVLKSGWLLNAEGQYRFKSGKFALGMNAHLTRLQKDNNPNDPFQNARMTIAALLFTAEWTITTKGNLQPYLDGGLGISFFNLNYEVSPGDGKTVFNVTFTMMPKAGLRYKVSENLYPFIETSLVLLADGPPVGFPKSSQMTGYSAITAGINYRFN